MVSELPMHGASGTEYIIQTWALTTATPDAEEATPTSFFKGLVIVNGSEKYRTKPFETEDDAYQDALDWSKAQEKKNK